MWQCSTCRTSTPHSAEPEFNNSEPVDRKKHVKRCDNCGALLDTIEIPVKEMNRVRSALRKVKREMQELQQSFDEAFSTVFPYG